MEIYYRKPILQFVKSCWKYWLPLLFITYLVCQTEFTKEIFFNLSRSLATQRLPPSKLPIYSLEIKDKHKSKLIPPGGDEQTNEKNYAPVKIYFKDDKTEYQGRAKIRLRGMNQVNNPHYKHSFKLVYPKNADVPQRELHLLTVRLKYSHWILYQMRLAQKLNIKTPDVRFARVICNGEDWGLYVEVQQFGKSIAEKYGLKNPTIFGESDVHPYPVNRYLWSNVHRWKKYDSNENSEFSRLYQFLSFIEESNDETFNKHIGDYLDLELAAAWQVHALLMDSYHQTSYGNSRIIYNDQSGKFELSSWDAIPNYIGTAQLPYGFGTIWANHLLSVRLMNHPEFLKIYSRKLYLTISEELDSFVKTMHALYSSQDILLAARSEKVDKIPKGKTYKELWFLAHYAQDWQKRINQSIRTIKHILVRRYINASSTQLFALAVKSPSYEKHGIQLNLSYDAAISSSLQRIRIPIQSKISKKKLTVEALLRPKQSNDNHFLPHHPSNRIHATQKKVLTASIHNGYLVMDHMGFSLLPNYPKILMQTFAGKPERFAQTRIEPQLYDLSIRFHKNSGYADLQGLRVEQMEILAISHATEEPVQAQIRFIRPNLDLERRLASTPPSTFAQNHQDFQFHPRKNQISVTNKIVRIKNTVVIPRGTQLLVPPGVTFLMDPEVSFISYSPIQITGTHDSPVIFRQSQENSKWGVIAVLNSVRPSDISNVKVRGASQSKYLGITFGGAINFHNAPYSASNIEISHSFSNKISSIGVTNAIAGTS